MGMSIDKAVHFANCLKNNYTIDFNDMESFCDTAIDSMHRCQRIAKAIDKVEEYICDVETDTVRAQGMAQALDMIEQVLGEIEDGKID